MIFEVKNLVDVFGSKYKIGWEIEDRKIENILL